jgi:hypothetical protein
VEWSGVEWSGVEWSGVEWSGVEWTKFSSQFTKSFKILTEVVQSEWSIDQMLSKNYR